MTEREDFRNSMTVGELIDHMAHDWLAKKWHKLFREDCEKLVGVALRSAARTGPDVVGFEAGRDAAVEIVRRWRDDAAKFSDERAQLMRNTCQNLSTAIAALPAPAGEGVTAYVLARIIEPGASGYTREFKYALELAEELLSTFTITRKSEARS